jgi:hypothetical protein
VAHFALRVSLAHSRRGALVIASPDPPDLAILDFDLAGSGVEPLDSTFSAAETLIVFVSDYRSHPPEKRARSWEPEKSRSAS